MPNSFDFSGRGPSTLRLVLIGVCLIAVSVAGGVAAVARSKGALENLVTVTASLTDVGDGLPARSDVKYHGVLVGSVSSVTAASPGQPNRVRIDLTPAMAASIPNTVTARVVPSNAFAVSAIELVDNVRGTAALHSGDVIDEDPTHPTIVLQSALSRARELFTAAGRAPVNAGVGPLTALGQATQGRGQRLTDAGHDLRDIAAQLNDVMSDDTSNTTTSALTAAADGLALAAPHLLDALDSGVATMRTLTEKQDALTHLLAAGQDTARTVADALDHQTNRLINITTQLTPPLGLLADHATDFSAISTRLQNLATKFYDEAWNPVTNRMNVEAIISFTPTRTYVRADCPRYGLLAGPSCQTAPTVPIAPALLPSLGSAGFPPSPGLTENRPNLAPPRDSINDPNVPPLTDPASPMEPPPAPPSQTSNSSLPASTAPAEPTPPAAAPTPPSTGDTPLPSSDSQPQSEVIGGTVGPVGGQRERDQLTQIIGTRADSATQLLLGPLARGTTVDVITAPTRASR